MTGSRKIEVPEAEVRSYSSMSVTKAHIRNVVADVDPDPSISKRFVHSVKTPIGAIVACIRTLSAGMSLACN